MSRTQAGLLRGLAGRELHADLKVVACLGALAGDGLEVRGLDTQGASNSNSKRLKIVSEH